MLKKNWNAPVMKKLWKPKKELSELSELIKEICKNKRGADNRKNIIVEMADCFIMLEQLAIIFDIPYHAINEVTSNKIERLEKRLAERSENGT